VEEAWNGKARRLHLYNMAVRIIMKAGRVTVVQYFSKFQECLRLSGKLMSTEDKVKTLKDGLKPDIRKLVVFTDFDSVSDLKQIALEMENLDEEKKFKSSKPRTKSHKSRKTKEVHVTARAIESSKKDVICEYCSKTGHKKEEFSLLRVIVADVRKKDIAFSRNVRNCDRSRADQVRRSQAQEKTSTDVNYLLYSNETRFGLSR